jgi:hypothetical protein
VAFLAGDPAGQVYRCLLWLSCLHICRYRCGRRRQRCPLQRHSLQLWLRLRGVWLRLCLRLRCTIPMLLWRLRLRLHRWLRLRCITPVLLWRLRLHLRLRWRPRREIQRRHLPQSVTSTAMAEQRIRSENATTFARVGRPEGSKQLLSEHAVSGCRRRRPAVRAGGARFKEAVAGSPPAANANATVTMGSPTWAKFIVFLDLCRQHHGRRRRQRRGRQPA